MPSRATAAWPRCPRFQPCRRTRCAGPQGRRGRRRCQARRLHRPAVCNGFGKCCTIGDAVISELQADRCVGPRGRISGEEFDPVVRRTKSRSPARWHRRARSALQAAHGFRPNQAQQVILNAQHRRRVDRFTLEDAFDQFAAFGQAENLRQGPCGRVAFQPLDSAGARISMPWAASPPSTFCQQKVVTSSLSQGRSMRKCGGGRIAKGQTRAVGRDQHRRWPRARRMSCRSM